MAEKKQLSTEQICSYYPHNVCVTFDDDIHNHLLIGIPDKETISILSPFQDFGTAAISDARLVLYPMELIFEKLPLSSDLALVSLAELLFIEFGGGYGYGPNQQSSFNNEMISNIKYSSWKTISSGLILFMKKHLFDVEGLIPQGLAISIIDQMNYHTRPK